MTDSKSDNENMAHESYAPSKAGTKKQTREGGGRRERESKREGGGGGRGEEERGRGGREGEGDEGS